MEYKTYFTGTTNSREHYLSQFNFNASKHNTRIIKLEKMRLINTY
jgi:hypothetical protein